MARRVPLVSYWDTEDFLSQPEAGSDDIILHIAKSARKAGLKACFCIIGDKVRSLVGRGRSDVIREISRHHDPLLHFNYGSHHPTTAELMTVSDWDDGVAVALAREAPGFRLFEETFGRCTGLTRHGMHYAAQIMRACAVERKVFWDSIVTMPETPFYWYCGALCFNSQQNIALDNHYADEGFPDILAGALDRLGEARQSGTQLAALFGHPHRAICEEFADISFYGGRNALHEDVRGPKHLPEHLKERVRGNLSALFEAMAKLKGFEVVTVAELAGRYGQRQTQVAQKSIRKFATKALDEGGPVYTEELSAAEGFLALAEYLLLERGRGAKPGAVRLPEALGPLSLPPETPPERTFERDQVIDIARDMLRLTARTGHLPHEAPGCGVGLGSALLMLAEAYLSKRSAPGTFAPRSAPPWPAVAEAMSAPIGRMPGWPCHDPDMDVSRILHYCQLMSWTLVPASEA